MAYFDGLKGKEIVFFGAVSNEINCFLIKFGVNPSYYVDNDRQKWNGYCHGIIIKPVEALLSESYNKNLAVVIVSYTHWAEMEAQIKKIGVSVCYVAYRDFDEFKSTRFQAFCRGIDVDYPVIRTLHLELSGYCNMKCIYCPFHGASNIKRGYEGFISWDMLKKIVDRMQGVETIDTLDVVGAGEIFLHREWYEMISFVLEKLPRIKQLFLYTNGLLLNDDAVEKMCKLDVERIDLEISIDGKSPEENNRFRVGSKYSVVRDNVKNAKKIIDEKRANVSIIITNCHPIPQSYVDDMEYKVNSKIAEVPDFLVNDFSNIATNIVSQWTYYYGLEKMEIPGLEIEEIQWPDNNPVCLNVFYRIAFDAFGRLLRCSCGTAGVEAIADIDKDDVIYAWFIEDGMKTARNNFINKKTEDDFCTGCPGKGMGKYQVLVRK